MWKRKMRKCGNEEMNKIHQGLPWSRRVLSPDTVSDFMYLL